MNEVAKRILIISYIFPPFPGIGGRRWAKFAKYLTREGYEVHLICAVSKVMEKSVWMQDVMDNKNLFIHTVDAFYPTVFTRKSANIFEKLRYKFWQIATSFLYHGYIYDKAIYSGNKFSVKAKEVIGHYQIQNVVVTGAPFRLVYYISRLRKQWPQFRLFADFRDPWTWEPMSHYQQLSKKKLDYERKLEAFVIKNADTILVPTKIMQEHLQITFPEYQKKCLVLPHAWDVDEIKPNFKINEQTIRLIWYGTLYSNLESYIKLVAKEIKIANGKIILDIFSDTNNYKELFDEAGALSWVNYYSQLPSRELYLLVRNYYAAIIINNDTDKDHVSTKFIELAASQTPIIYIANSGAAADFVSVNDLGWHLNIHLISGFFDKLRNGTLNKPSSKLDIEQLSFKNVTRELVKLMEGQH